MSGICIFCGRKCANMGGLSKHEKHCKENPDKVEVVRSQKWHDSMKAKRGKTARNKYSKARQEGKPLPMSDETKEKLRQINLGKKWPEEQKQRHKEIMRKAVLENPVSYSTGNVSGKVKTYEFNGMLLKGGWELLVAQCMWVEDIEFTNDIQDPFPYTYKGEEHLYFPDFYLPKQEVYVEVKGFKTPKDKCKWTGVDNLVVIMKPEIEKLHSGEQTMLEIVNRSLSSVGRAGDS